MPNTSWKRNGELMHALFDVLHEHGPDGMPAGDAVQEVAKRTGLTDYEAGHYPNGIRRFDKILRFATIGPVKAGWIVKDSGRWYITDEGWQAHTSLTDPLHFTKRSTELYDSWKKGQPAKPTEPADDVEEAVEDSAVIALETAEEQARAQIEQHLKAMNPYEFQFLVADLLTAMGYHISWVSPPGKDDGVDIIAFADPLGMRPPRIKVQVKRYDKPVAVSDVSAFMGNLGAEEVGLFVSTGNFTKDAEQKVRTDKQHRVTLIGLDALIKLWVQHYDKLGQQAKLRLPLRPVYFLALDE
ncbi:MAG: restriction endonuclease [Gemmatimonadaceae bacterium]